MLVVTKDNSIYFVSGSVGEVKSGRDNPLKVKWGKVNPEEGSIDTREGKLLCLVMGLPMIIEDNFGSLTTAPVEKVILE